MKVDFDFDKILFEANENDDNEKQKRTRSAINIKIETQQLFSAVSGSEHTPEIVSGYIKKTRLSRDLAIKHLENISIRIWNIDAKT